MKGNIIKAQGLAQQRRRWDPDHTDAFERHLTQTVQVLGISSHNGLNTHDIQRLDPQKP